MREKVLIFDLDGTLLDTLGDLKEAVNHAMRSLGYPERDSDEIRRFVGDGIRALVERALPQDAEKTAASSALSLFREYYFSHLNVFTRPYPGIDTLLRKAADSGYRIGICSNKIQSAVTQLCEFHFRGSYDLAFGESDLIPKKPDPTGTNALLRSFGAAPEEALYIGDSSTDVRTAANASVRFLWAGWGFRTRAEMGDELSGPGFETPYDLERYLFSSGR